jgi:acetyl-CoA acetyltransferase
MAKEVYIAGAGLTEVDLTGREFKNVFELFGEAYRRALRDATVSRVDAIQVGIMTSEEFEGRANIAAKIADRLHLTGTPAVRSETASSTGAAAFHEACYKIASGRFENVLVLAGERMKTVDTNAATAIMSKTIDPAERRFGFTMPALIALITQAWFRERKLRGSGVAEVLAHLMYRAHALGAENPIAAFRSRPEPLEAYHRDPRNLPVATPLRRKDCSPLCDGAAAVLLTAKPQPVRVAGLGSATETSSILDREHLACLDATREAARSAYWQAGIANPRELEGRVVEIHDAFNSLLPISLADLDLVDADDAIDALIGSGRRKPIDPYANPVTGVRGSCPVNLSGGLKARGHPVGGTGLYQIAEVYLQIAGRFPNLRAQVPNAKIGLAHSIGGPGNNVYVTILEDSDNRRERARLTRPEPRIGPRAERRERRGGARLHGARAIVEAATSIHVTSGNVPAPVHVALLTIDGRRVFAKLDHAADDAEHAEQALAGQSARILVKDDGDHYFQIRRRRGWDVGRLVESIRRRVPRPRDADASGADPEAD